MPHRAIYAVAFVVVAFVVVTSKERLFTIGDDNEAGGEFSLPLLRTA